MVIGTLLLVTTSGSSQTRSPLRTYQQAYDLQQLNVEYAALLQAKRRQLVPDAPAVVFDAAPLKGVVEHNRVMEASNKLFDADQARCVELMGMNNGLWQWAQDPKKLAQAIWSQFQASVKGHGEAQASPDQYRVAVSCSQNYFIVRLQPIQVISNEE